MQAVHDGCAMRDVVKGSCGGQGDVIAERAHLGRVLQEPLVRLLLGGALKVPLTVAEHRVHVRLVLHRQV